jgi:single-stranded-DNA-specific exonuclease
MNILQPQWQLQSPPKVSQWLIEAIKPYTVESQGKYAAQLLWQRGIQEPEKLAGFLNPDCYQPASPFAFGEEMQWAVNRLRLARASKERVTIWGDFDADGVTATSVLWEGLGQFFPQHKQLSYYIPNRLTESHGLNCPGLERLAASGTRLIVTCDTGSTNLSEIDYASQLGIEIIITDHHTLPDRRPPVVAIVNPRYFDETHSLFHLSGVAVAYKLMEALYQTLPDVPQQPLEILLDLVAIGLIADLVHLSGDCRYLAQKGIQQLQKQSTPLSVTRPGIASLLELCQKSGDRPTDISFGLGPRINAVSRIQGDGSFCVELLTSRDVKRCQQLALETELANTRRKSLQKEVLEQAQKKLSWIDLSTTSVIVLEDSQWHGGVLGLVAGQIAQEYGRPTILLSTAVTGQREEKTRLFQDSEFEEKNSIEYPLARGSARSVNQIDLYQLVASQSHLLHSFGGHPFAAGLSLPINNISLFREAINQQLWQQNKAIALMTPIITADLKVSVAELGKALFRELKLIEPCGMGNPVPKLLLQNCWFEKVRNTNAQDVRGKKIQYIKTTFEIWDDSVKEGFPGIWWGHYQEELPQNQRCDAIVELDFNTYHKRYESRLIAVRPTLPYPESIGSRSSHRDYLFDCRDSRINPEEMPALFRIQQAQSLGSSPETAAFKILQDCPTNWDEIQVEYRQAIAQQQKLALAYSAPEKLPPEKIWQQLVGIAKYLSRTSKTITKAQLQDKLTLGDRSLELGFQALSDLGFKRDNTAPSIRFARSSDIASTLDRSISLFLEAIEEEQFQRQYFSEIPLAIVEGMVANP